MKPTNEDQLKKDNQEALELLRSEDWRVYREFIKKRIRNFQDQVNSHVASGDLVEAKVALALMKDSEKLINVFVQQTVLAKESLNKSKEK